MLFFGVPYGTRTRTASLEGWGAAITPMKHLGRPVRVELTIAEPQSAVLPLHYEGHINKDKGGIEPQPICSYTNRWF